MRIISGSLGGRRIHPPAKMPHTRPTTDIAKEGLFNVLQNNLDFENLKTLDLFAGTGCISYELASRGAADLTVVEMDAQMIAFIKKTSASLNIENLQVVQSDVFRYIRSCNESYDFIFAGPPYAMDSIDNLPRIIFEKGLLNPGGWFVLEHTPRNHYEEIAFFKSVRNYGTTLFSIFENSDQSL
ncbi:MAG: RsmD family RNA methyltransferase [Chitinophagaceae bacterium]